MEINNERQKADECKFRMKFCLRIDFLLKFKIYTNFFLYMLQEWSHMSRLITASRLSRLQRLQKINEMSQFVTLMSSDGMNII